MGILPDVLKPGLKVVFCGTAVGNRTAEVGQYYAGPRNRFWAVLQRVGLTPALLTAADYPRLTDYGIGLTDLVKTASGNDDTLTASLFDAAGFRARIEAVEPLAVAFNGKLAGQVFLGRPVEYGRQAETIGKTAIFVLPSTSGAASGYWDEAPWLELAAFVNEQNNDTLRNREMTDMDRMLETLRDLTEIHAPSGHEAPVAEYIAARLHDVARSIEIDALGNLIVQAGNPNAPAVVIDAHMDEVGLVVKRVDGAGNVLFDKIGMVDDRVLLGREVDVLAPGGAIRGVIGIKGRHLQTAQELAQQPDVRQMWIDTGLNQDELVAAGVMPGVGIAYTTRFQPLKNGFILGKALDCRIGCVVAMETLRRLVESRAAILDQVNLTAIFTVQEEIGSKGAAVAAFGLEPKLAIVLDTVPVEDPVVPASAQSLRLGAGPVLRMFDFHPQTFYGCYTHPVLRQLMLAAAVDAGVPHQVDIMMSTWLDSATLHRTGSGIPTGTVCFPRRYSHSPTEVAHIDDAENAVRLLMKIVERAPGAEFRRKLK